MQWMRYSHKEYCELCGHKFSFQPIYSPDMPRVLPLRDVIGGLLMVLLKAAKSWVHFSLVGIAWFVTVPLTAYRTYRYIFQASTIHDLILLPLDVFSPVNLASDMFRGCFVVTCTLLSFIGLVWLREQILLGGGPDWLEREDAPVQQVANEVIDDGAQNAAEIGAGDHVQQAAEDINLINLPVANEEPQEPFEFGDIIDGISLDSDVNSIDDSLPSPLQEDNEQLIGNYEEVQSGVQDVNVDIMDPPVNGAPAIPNLADIEDELPLIFEHQQPQHPRLDLFPNVNNNNYGNPIINNFAGNAAHLEEPQIVNLDNDNDNDDANWNPMDWDRAADDLTWERLLGLDGSLVFLEHVFWIVLLNIMLIFTFAFCPYCVGQFVLVSFNVLQSDKQLLHFQGLITTLFGYCFIGHILVILHFFAKIFYMKRLRNLIGFCYIVVKVSMLCVVEIGVFPLICGWWLDICSLPLFDAT